MGGRILGGYEGIDSKQLETQLKSKFNITGRLNDGWEDEICHDCAPAGPKIEFIILNFHKYSINNSREINNIKYDLKSHFKLPYLIVFH